MLDLAIAVILAIISTRRVLSTPWVSVDHSLLVSVKVFFLPGKCQEDYSSKMCIFVSTFRM